MKCPLFFIEALVDQSNVALYSPLVILGRAIPCRQFKKQRCSLQGAFRYKPRFLHVIQDVCTLPQYG